MTHSTLTLDISPDRESTGSASTAASAHALLADYVNDDAGALAELLDACHFKAAGDRARALVKGARTGTHDPAALSAQIYALSEDLANLPAPIRLEAPDRLQSIQSADVDAAARYHIGRLTSLAALLRGVETA